MSTDKPSPYTGYIRSAVIPTLAGFFGVSDARSSTIQRSPAIQSFCVRRLCRDTRGGQSFSRAVPRAAQSSPIRGTCTSTRGVMLPARLLSYFAKMARPRWRGHDEQRLNIYEYAAY